MIRLSVYATIIPGRRPIALSIVTAIAATWAEMMTKGINGMTEYISDIKIQIEISSVLSRTFSGVPSSHYQRSIYKRVDSVRLRNCNVTTPLSGPSLDEAKLAWLAGVWVPPVDRVFDFLAVSGCASWLTTS